MNDLPTITDTSDTMTDEDQDKVINFTVTDVEIGKTQVSLVHPDGSTPS